MVKSRSSDAFNMGGLWFSQLNENMMRFYQNLAKENLEMMYDITECNKEFMQASSTSTDITKFMEAQAQWSQKMTLCMSNHSKRMQDIMSSATAEYQKNLQKENERAADIEKSVSDTIQKSVKKLHK